MDMLNGNKVNAARRNFYLPQFCRFFRISGQILHFKKSVKYSGSSDINGAPALLNRIYAVKTVIYARLRLRIP